MVFIMIIIFAFLLIVKFKLNFIKFYNTKMEVTKTNFEEAFNYFEKLLPHVCNSEILNYFYNLD